jgi:hypothetical protein
MNVAESRHRILESLRRLRSHGPLLILIGAFVLVHSFYWDCPPIWDGMADFVDLYKAKQRPFDLLNYGVDGHNCQGFMLVMGLPYALFQRNYHLFNIWFTLFGLFSVIGFYQLLAFFLEECLQKWEMALMTALFVFHPSVVSGMMHFCLDVGVLVFFVLYWVQLLKERRAAAALLGLLLVFSKETALLLLPIPFVFCLLRHNRSDQWQWFRRHLGVLAVPYLAFGFFVVYKTMYRHELGVWRFYPGYDSYTAFGPARVAVNYFGELPSLINYLGMIFVMNFNWLLVLLWGVLLGMVLGRRRPEKPAPQRRTAFLLLFCFVAATIVLTLVRPYSNVRYVMVAFPIMFLAVVQLSCVAGVSSLTRAAWALAGLALFAWADLRTIDPVSKAFFGTFNFGSHPMLYMTKRTGEPVGFGQDQLVYNLEFVKFRQLLEMAMRDIRPTAQTYFLSYPKISGYTFTSLDRDCRLTFETNGAFSPQYLSSARLLQLPRLPKDVYYLDFPNYDSRADIALAGEHYPQKTARVYDLNGYQLNVIHFELGQ